MDLPRILTGRHLLNSRSACHVPREPRDKKLHPPQRTGPRLPRFVYAGSSNRRFPSFPTRQPVYLDYIAKIGHTTKIEQIDYHETPT